MIACKTLIHSSLFPFVIQCRIRGSTFGLSGNPSSVWVGSRHRSICLPPSFLGFGFDGRALAPLRPYSYSMEAAVDRLDDVSGSLEDTVEEMLVKGGRIDRLMKMERRSEVDDGGKRGLWFPYLDEFRSGSSSLTSREVVEVLDPYIMEVRKEKMRNVVKNRSYSVCLVVEGLTDFGNVSAAFRSADALGIQSVHVISSDINKRYRDNRHVSMGAEKWLDIELWRSPTECFRALKLRGYRIATTHLATDAVSIYDMDWSCPTAIVVGNEHRGISDVSLRVSDLHCSIPMSGMVDSFNVSVAAGILMHHAVSDRVSRLSRHGDLTSEESQILLAEFFLRHRKSTVDIIQEYAKRDLGKPLSKL